MPIPDGLGAERTARGSRSVSKNKNPLCQAVLGKLDSFVKYEFIFTLLLYFTFSPAVY